MVHYSFFLHQIRLKHSGQIYQRSNVNNSFVHHCLLFKSCLLLKICSSVILSLNSYSVLSTMQNYNTKQCKISFFFVVSETSSDISALFRKAFRKASFSPAESTQKLLYDVLPPQFLGRFRLVVERPFRIAATHLADGVVDSRTTRQTIQIQHLQVVDELLRTVEERHPRNQPFVGRNHNIGIIAWIAEGAVFAHLTYGNCHARIDGLA